jgi:hypothetical protein
VLVRHFISSVFLEAAARVLANSFRPVGGGKSGANIIDRNSVFAEFVSQTLSQAHHRAGGPLALVTRISTVPNFWETAATKRPIAGASVTSRASTRTSTPYSFSNVVRSRLQSLRVAGTPGQATALGRKAFGGGSANPLTGGRDQGNSIFQTPIHDYRPVNVEL